jgi:hypothetical protein
VGTTDVINKNEWYEDVKIAEKTVNVQLDTGARCKRNQKHSSSRTLVMSSTILPCEYKRKTYQVKFRVVDIPVPPVFSANT